MLITNTGFDVADELPSAASSTRQKRLLSNKRDTHFILQIREKVGAAAVSLGGVSWYARSAATGSFFHGAALFP